jgi:uncharacterized protein
MAEFRTNSSRFLEVVVKVTEVCNINCTYCYVFNRGNDDYVTRPDHIRQGTIDDIVAFIKDGIAALDIKMVGIVLHGGEPLMMRKDKFEQFCAKLRTELGQLVQLTLAVQTNAILIDDEWLAVFERQGISPSVSLDGPSDVHDLNRVDKRGKGTYAKALAGLQRLKAASDAGKLAPTGIICVVDPYSNARDVYRHIVHELGFSQVAFNLPMETLETMDQEKADLYKKYVTDLFEAWTADNNPKIKIRMFDDMFQFLAGNELLIDHLPEVYLNHVLAVIASDGTLSDHDDYKVINFAQRGGNVRTTSLEEYANSPLREYLHHLNTTLPDDCKACEWANVCRAGASQGLVVSRYSPESGFNNRSAYCETLQAMYEAGATYLAANGVAVETMQAALAREARDPAASPMPPPRELFSEAALIPAE